MVVHKRETCIGIGYKFCCFADLYVLEARFHYLSKYSTIPSLELALFERYHKYV